MKQLFIAFLVLGLLAAFAVPVLAQSDEMVIPPEDIPDWTPVGFSVGVGKRKGIVGNKSVTKTYTFEPQFSDAVHNPAWAEVEVFKWDLLTGNQATVQRLVSSNEIEGSFNTFKGISQVNQAAGFLNNQGNVLAASVTGVLPTNYSTDDVSMVEAAVGHNNYSNEVTLKDSVLADGITSSFNTFNGLAQVNQAAGLMNNQNNVMALGANQLGNGFVAENDTFLGMFNHGNTINIVPVAGSASGSGGTQVVTTAAVNSSFNDFIGAAQVNQAPGTLNNQANVISISHAVAVSGPNFSQ